MSTKVDLKRGFKANAEKLAKQYREELRIHPCGSLCAFKLSEHLEIPVFKATDFLNDPSHLSLLRGDNAEPCEWSALTMIAGSGNRIIVYNPYHSRGRQQSDVMHEMAHIICRHEHILSDHGTPLPFGMRNYDAVQEEEAKCLGATLQLATPCLLWARKRAMSYEEIASHFDASIAMVKYRMNMTGIARRR